MSAVNVTVLGPGDAFASRGLSQAGYAIEANGTRILMEAGPTIMVSMKRCGISPADLDVILISHLHGDHFAGLPFLILEYMYESPLHKPITIAGPPHLEERTWALFRDMYPEFDLSGIMPKLKFVVLDPGKTARLGELKVDTIRTPHTIKDISLAFRVEAGGKIVAFSGDTGWTDELIRLTAGADLFLSECTFFQTKTDFHLSYPMIVANRERFAARRMVLTHIGREVVDRASEVDFPMASEGMTIDL